MTRTYEPIEVPFGTELFEDYFESDSDSFMWEANPGFNGIEIGCANRRGDQIDRVIKAFEQIGEHAM